MLQKVYRDIAFTCSKRFHIPTSSIKIANQTVVDVSKVYSRKTNAVKQANHKKKIPHPLSQIWAHKNCCYFPYCFLTILIQKIHQGCYCYSRIWEHLYSRSLVKIMHPVKKNTSVPKQTHSTRHLWCKTIRNQQLFISKELNYSPLHKSFPNQLLQAKPKCMNRTFTNKMQTYKTMLCHM